ncbi:MAG: MFS transporter, partial [Actinobacteria bacterium]|nr:MFS transporter [Actinomycetota bacterium]
MRFSVKSDGNWRAFRHRNFRILYPANTASNIGGWVQRIAQDWLVLELTHSGTYLGIITALQFAPVWFVSLPGGALADRFNKRKVLMVTNFAAGLTSLILGLLVVSHNVKIWHVMVLAFALGVADAVDKPVRQSFTSEMVGLTDMPNAVSLNSANFNLGRLIGPALSGIMIAAFGTGPAFLVNAASYLAVIIVMANIRESELFKEPRTPGPTTIREGLNYVMARPDLFVVMSVVFFVTTFGLNFQLFNALMATKVFDKGVTTFGLMGTIIAIGSLSAALFSPRIEKYRSTKFVIASAFVFGICIFIISFMPNYLTYVIMLPIAGAAALTTMIAANSTVQTNSDNAVRGRVMGIYQFVFLGGAPLVNPFLGLLSETLGIRQTIALCGSITILAASVIWLKFKDHLAVPADISIAAVL